MLSSRGQAAVAALMLLGVAMPVTVAVAQGADAPDIGGDTGIFAADPSIIHTDDGYVAIESRGGRALFVRVAPSLEELADAPSTRIWSDREGLGEVWAPEIVFRNGRYEIYFAAGRASEHRMYAITATEPAGTYGAVAEIVLPEDKWAIDGLPFAYRGEDYFIWSGWQGDTDVQQDIFIVRLDADGEPETPRARIASPSETWENIAGDTPTINEGPQPIIDPAGQLHVSYSANGSWGPNYCIADLRLKADGDPLDPSAWFKSDGCLFGANADTLAETGTLATLAKGVGHQSFVLADGQAEQADADEEIRQFVYHGVPAEEEPSNFWAARKWYIGQYQWVPDVAYGSGDSSDIGWSLRFIE